MTYASTLAIGQTVQAEAGLIIDGIPILFGTKADLVLTTSSIFVSGAPASLTSNDALARNSVGVEGLELNTKMGMVPPGGASLRIRSGEWDRYFERRRALATGTTKARLTAAMTASATSCTTSAAGVWSVGDVIYVDREAMYVGALTSSDPSTLTRNYAGLAGTKAARHQAGARVSKSPRTLLGRYAELYLWINEVDSTLLRRLKLTNVRWDGKTNEWVLTFKDAMALFDRVIAKGLRGTTLSEVAVSGSNAELVKVGSTWDEEWLATGSADYGSAYLTNGQDYVVAPIQSFSAGNDPRIPWEYRVSSFLDTLGLYNNIEDQGVTMRRVYVLSRYPMVAALKVLLSDRGDGNNNATYDKLYGRTSTGGGAGETLGAYEEEIRFGAAIPEALLDMTTLTSTELLTDPGIGEFRYVLGANGEEKLLDFLAEVAWHLQGFWFINSSGKLSFKRLSGVYAATTVAATFTEDTVLGIRRETPYDAVDDETEVVTSIKLKCNWNPAKKGFDAEVNLIYPRTAETFRDIGQAVEFERKTCLVNAPTAAGSLPLGSVGATVQEVQSALNRRFFRAQNGLRKYTLILPIAYHQLQPGDNVRVTRDGLKAFDGSSVSSMLLEIVKQGSIDLKTGLVRFEVVETWSSKPISPTGKVSSISGAGPYTVTLATNTKYGGGTTPARYFAAGWKVKFLDQSVSPPFSTESGTMTISSITSDTVLVMTGTIGFTVAAGDILVQAAYATGNDTTTNAAQTLAQHGYSFQGTTGFALGTGTPPAQADEWG
jgi:hypothetical protein